MALWDSQPTKEKWQVNVMGLTEDQQTALDCCMSGKNVFITGGGGVGKTYLIHKVVDCLKEAGRRS